MADPKLYLVRHGQTDWNAQHRFQGQRDIPINATGRGQARRSGETLKSILDDPTALDYVASPLSRARETMEIIRQVLGLPTVGYRTDGRLKEVSYGAWEGYTTHEVKDLIPKERRRRKNDKYNFIPPQGESYAMLLARVLSWLPYVERDTVVVAHGGVIRVLMHHLGGMDPTDAVNLVVPQDRILLWDGETPQWVE
ncbi:MAG: histidine phosphatase family protein [Ahrensia sp.]|nr:histidine phosphatase family protein [Ahrensia sp.]